MNNTDSENVNEGMYTHITIVNCMGINDLFLKWSPILEEIGFKHDDDSYEKLTIARMLEKINSMFRMKNGEKQTTEEMAALGFMRVLFKSACNTGTSRDFDEMIKFIDDYMSKDKEND